MKLLSVSNYVFINSTQQPHLSLSAKLTSLISSKWLVIEEYLLQVSISGVMCREVVLILCEQIPYYYGLLNSVKIGSDISILTIL